MGQKSQWVIPADIAGRILLVRSQGVMLDADLARLYGVTTKRLNEQVSRNRKRFPTDFMLRLTRDEALILRSRFATSRRGWGGRRFRPFAFTEHGAVMLACVLKSQRAVNASLQVVRAFVRFRQLGERYGELARVLGATQKAHGRKFATVFYLLEEHDERIKRLEGGEPRS